MKRILVLLAVLVPYFMQAQHFEAGVMVGISNYRGDLDPESVWETFGQTHASFGGLIRYNINDYVAARFNVYYGTVSGDDAVGTPGQQQRNLSFKSNILEFAIGGEFNILGYQPYGLERVFSPYVFASIGIVRYNPKAFIDGRWVELQPLGTEGQGLAAYPDKDLYSLTALTVPFGVGAKYAINDRWNLGIEMGLRYTNTDYLDDISTTYPDLTILREERGDLAADLSDRSLGDTPRRAGSGRGDPGSDDWYFVAGLTITYNFFDNGLVGSRGRNRRKTGCQTF